MMARGPTRGYHTTISADQSHRVAIYTNRSTFVYQIKITTFPTNTPIAYFPCFSGSTAAPSGGANTNEGNLIICFGEHVTSLTLREIRLKSGGPRPREPLGQPGPGEVYVMGLGKRQQRLLDTLRELEAEETVLGATRLCEVLVTQTGYRPSTIRSYLTKNLRGELVYFDGDDAWVSGALDCSDTQFEALMTQKKAGADAFEGMDSERKWRERLRSLTRLGEERGYLLGETDAERLLDLVELANLDQRAAG